eukprot:tig00021247_g19673.t1
MHPLGRHHVICGALFLVSELLGGTERVRPNTVLGALKAAALRVAIGPHHVDIQMTQTEAAAAKEPAEMAADLDRCTRRAIASYAKRVEQYHPQMAEDARAYAKNPAASPPVMAAVIDRLQWALHEEGERFAGYYFVGPYLLTA